MRLRCEKAIVWLIVMALVIVPGAAMAYDGPGMADYTDPQVETGAMVADAIAVRPLGIVSTVLGFGFFVVSVPFSALGGNAGDAWRALVVRPAKFTFARPLGDFDLN